ncbi:MAG: HAMP domain-containing sensor histidine kinase [Oscillatoriaceae cyanobacterium]
MFNGIRYRLLLSYLLVLASILMVFALAVRLVFTRSLMHQITEKLRALGEGAAAMAFEDGQIEFNTNVYYERDLIAHEQALQWFDKEGNLMAQQGVNVVSLPLEKRESVQWEDERRIEAVTLPIVGSNGGEIVGYVRASQFLVKVDETIQKLDWGLAGGILMALVLSGGGGVWLTRQAMQPIEDSFQRLKQFTADASHELRSPLMAIKSNVAVALRYSEGMREPDREKFEAIASATNQMTQLTEDLLLLARTERMPGQDWEPVDLGLMLQNLINLYKTQGEGKEITLRASIRENLYVAGDAGQLTRLFVNLIQNALHYTPAGGTIWVSGINFGVYIEVEVRDTGVGIAPSDVEKVFERFWRADRSRSYWQGGSGLGLAIARAIVQQHGGSINVTSELGIGSCFTVRLPANSPI